METPNEFRNIVVALDGSPEAEQILAYVKPIARAFESNVTLVCALVPVEDTVYGELALSGSATGPAILDPLYETENELGKRDRSYLATLKQRGLDAGFEVTCAEPEMRAADAIVKIAAEKNADLIAMATHARSGVKRAFLGSVADDVVRNVRCPVLLMRISHEDESSA